MTIEEALKAFEEMYGEIDKENWLFIGTINPKMVEHAIQALSIVRCKDCKYCDGGIDEDGKPFLKCLSGRSYGGTNADDYCSWAERREDAKID